MRSSGFAFEDLMRGTFEDLSNRVFTEMTDLNLGKWSCLDNSWSGGSEKSPSSVIPTPSSTTAAATKKQKPPSPIPGCKVEGCNLDLSGAKDYHRKHRVCDSHSKSPLVIVKGLEQRFCQQCSRFHGLSEFDENKRSCRKRLAAHNARRRKKLQGTIEFNPSRIPPSFYGQQLSGNQVYYPISMHRNSSNGFLVPNGTANSGVLNPQGLNNVPSGTEFDRALYLLSSNYWGSCEPVSLMSMPQTLIHAGTPQQQSSEYWLLDGQPSTCPRGIGTDFYFSPLHYY